MTKEENAAFQKGYDLGLKVGQEELKRQMRELLGVDKEISEAISGHERLHEGD